MLEVRGDGSCFQGRKPLRQVLRAYANQPDNMSVSLSAPLRVLWCKGLNRYGLQLFWKRWGDTVSRKKKFKANRCKLLTVNGAVSSLWHQQAFPNGHFASRCGGFACLCVCCLCGCCFVWFLSWFDWPTRNSHFKQRFWPRGPLQYIQLWDLVSLGLWCNQVTTLRLLKTQICVLLC